MKNSRHKIIAGARIHFERFVDSQTAPSEEPLPLTHTTDAFDLRDIIADREIKPRYCSVFGEDLSYHFYGRPAYRKNAETQANSLAAYAPVIFIFKPTVADKAIAAFPFDSGAYVGERYSDIMHHRMSVKDFGLAPPFEKIGKLVAFYFGNNKRYFDQIPSSIKGISSSEFEAQSIKELVTYRGKNERDDRSSTIEIVFDRAIELRGNLLGIIVPNSFIKDRAFRAQLTSTLKYFGLRFGELRFFRNADLGNISLTSLIGVQQLKREATSSFARARGSNLRQITKSYFEDPSGVLRVVCTFSSRYEGKGKRKYWFGYHETWDRWLEESEESFLLLGCVDTRMFLRYRYSL